MEKTIKNQALEITQLKARVQLLEERKKSRQDVISKDALNRGGVQEQGEEYVHKQKEEFHAKEVTPEKEASKSTDKDSESTGDLANVLTSMGVTNVLASGSKTEADATATQQVPTASATVPNASVTFSTASILDSPAIVVPSASPIPSLSTLTIITRRKGKEKMVEEEPPKKSKKELRSEQFARELVEKFKLEDKRRKEQITINERIARIEAERELQAMIEELDRSDKVVNKHLEEYEQHEGDLTLEENIELVQAKRKEFYIAVLRSHDNWKAKYFKGMTFEQIEAKFILFWESIQHFEPIDFSSKSKGVKRFGEALTQEASKKSKTASQEGLSKEQIKEMIVGEFTELYQFFEDLVKAVDRKNLDTLWKMAQELQESRKLEDPKEMEL
ncbi:hypothetical protein Tco_0895492 [Tanacetum coccineum]|uniref:Uncharacterized protein n=1 Tax=Tanacetum coccineum TaxID=301880 RepID=A0ABQ5CER1_9ASTR